MKSQNVNDKLKFEKNDLTHLNHLQMFKINGGTGSRSINTIDIDESCIPMPSVTKI